MLHGQTRFNLKSRFFEELPEAALKWITPRNAGFGSGRGVSAQGGYGNRGLQPAWGQSGFGSGSTLGAPVPQKAAPSHGVVVGKQVFHNKFGEGRVLAIEGSGDGARAQIDFPRHGTKWLALSVAKLTVI